MYPKSRPDNPQRNNTHYFGFAELDQAAIRCGKDRALALYYLLRHADATGRGSVSVAQARTCWKGSKSSLWRVLKEGQDTFWFWDLPSKMIYLKSLGKVERALGDRRLKTAYQAPLKWLTGKHTQPLLGLNSFVGERVANETIANRLGVTERTIRRWRSQTKWPVKQHYEVREAFATLKEAWEAGRQIRKSRNRRGGKQPWFRVRELAEAVKVEPGKIVKALLETRGSDLLLRRDDTLAVKKDAVLARANRDLSRRPSPTRGGNSHAWVKAGL